MSNKAFVFPGQGSQAVGMLNELADKYPIIIDNFNEVSYELGFDYWNLVQQGPADLLNQTEYTQVVMLVADVAVYNAMLSLEKIAPPFIMAGHSLGEYAALVCAESLDLVTAATLVRTRGRLMQESIPLGVGAMAAIVGLNDLQVEQLCAKATQYDELVTPANYNAIGQVVIAGHVEAVNRALNLAQDLQAKLATIIQVSVPCHCPLLTAASAKYAEFLQKITFKPPKIKVISNVDLSIYNADTQIKKLLAQQLYAPVQWVKTVKLMQQSGISEIVECGPGKVLSGLVKRIDRSIAVSQISQQLLDINFVQ